MEVGELLELAPVCILVCRANLLAELGQDMRVACQVEGGDRQRPRRGDEAGADDKLGLVGEPRVRLLLLWEVLVE
jgi:hypothetical protein